MREILAIFKKDVRRAWPGILLSLALGAASGWLGSKMFLNPNPMPNIIEILWFLSCVYLGVVVIHEEAIPGDTQYWLTRPIGWRSLLLAKALFFVTFVHLPFLVTEAFSLAANGVSPAGYVPQLLFNDFITMGTFSLAIAGVALVTNNFMQFVFGALAAMVPVIVSMILSGPRLSDAASANWGPFEWIRTSISLTLLLVCSMAILLLQYARRKTMFSRILGAAAAVIVSLIPFLGGWHAAFAVQSRIAPQPAGAGTVRIAFDPRPAKPTLALGGKRIDVDLPIVVSGIPSNAWLLCDRMNVHIAAGNQFWDSGWSQLSQVPELQGLPEVKTNASISIDRSFYNTVQDTPADLHARVAFTILTGLQESPVHGPGRTASLPGNAICSAMPGEPFAFLSCAWPGRAPARAYLRVRLGEHALPSSHPIITGSYSPFPGEGSIWRTGGTGYGWIAGPIDLTLYTWQKAAHFERDFDIHGIRLADYGGRL